MHKLAGVGNRRWSNRPSCPVHEPATGHSTHSAHRSERPQSGTYCKGTSDHDGFGRRFGGHGCWPHGLQRGTRTREHPAETLRRPLPPNSRTLDEEQTARIQRNRGSLQKRLPVHRPRSQRRAQNPNLHAHPVPQIRMGLVRRLHRAKTAKQQSVVRVLLRQPVHDTCGKAVSSRR